MSEEEATSCAGESDGDEESGRDTVGQSAQNVKRRASPDKREQDAGPESKQSKSDEALVDKHAEESVACGAAETNGASGKKAETTCSVFAAYTSSESPFASVGSGGFGGFGKSSFATFSSSGLGAFGGSALSSFASKNDSGDAGSGAFGGGSTVFGGTSGQTISHSIFGSSTSNKAFKDKNKDKDDEDAENDEEDGNADDDAEGGVTNPVDPPVEDVVTGEEGEELLFKIRAKLYRLSDVVEVTPSSPDFAAPKIGGTRQTGTEKPVQVEEPSKPAEPGTRKEFKELGSGLVRLNQPASTDGTESAPPRIVMRREGTLKLILNAAVWDKMPLDKASDKLIRFTCYSVLDESTSEPELDTFLLRLPRADQCEELFQAMDDIRKKFVVSKK